MNKKILVFGIVIILNFSAFFVLANDEFLMIDDGSISGYVRQVNGNPIIDAMVIVMRQDGWWGSVNYTGSDGSYKIDGIPEGDYKIQAFKSGYARLYYNNVFYSSEAEIIHIEESDEITGIDFNLTLGGAISGFVFDQKDGNPINGAHIHVRPSNYFFDEGIHVYTDSNGSYYADGLPLGNYKVIAVESEGYVNNWFYNGTYNWEDAKNVMVIPPHTTSGINISLELAGSISGYVFAGDGVTPIPQIEIIADGFDGGGGGSGFAGEDGSYQIKGLLGNFTLRTGDLYYPGWYAGEFYNSKLTQGSADIVDVSAGSNISNINFTLDEGGSITGYVFDEETGDPITGFQLCAHLSNGDGVNPAPLTLYDGSFRFALKEGTYFITIFWTHGYVPEWYNNSYDFEKATPVSVTPYHETSGINFYLSRGGSINGYIVDEGGNPVNGASVYAFSNNFPGNGAITSEDGNYVIEGLPSDDYLVQVTASGFNTQYYDKVSDSADATLVTVYAPEETKNIDFVLTQGIGVYISRPEIGDLYLFDKEILSLPFNFPIIVGKINVKAVAFGADKVEFYVNDELKHTDNESPFSWLWEEFVFARHKLKVVVYEVVDVVRDEIIVWKFF
jgi:hypothetical protein